MAFPGDRKWKLAVTIPAASILGDPVNDLWVRITHVSLPDAMITAGGEYALQSTGTDLAASSDTLGETQIPLYVRRCDLDATAADSRVQIWVRRQDVADATDTVIWLWWGSETETAPAVDEYYGRNDVFGSTTGTGAPPDGFGVWLFDEDPSDPSPCYKDHTGGGHDLTKNGTLTRGDAAAMNVRGVVAGGDGSDYPMAAFTWAPGTADFTLLWGAAIATGFNSYVFGTTVARISSDIVLIDAAGYPQLPGISSSPAVVGFSRDGDSILLSSAEYDHTSTGMAAEVFSWPNATFNDSGLATRTFIAFVDTALNVYWIRAFHDCLTAEATFFSVGEIEAAAVAAVLTFSPLAAGSEVRIYEQPHPQAWTIDFADIAVADLDGVYFTFQVMGSGGATDHYAWFDLDNGSTDPEPAGLTGHEVDVATGDTDEDIADAVATVLAGITDLDATVSTTVVTVTNERDGELEPPADATGASATGADINVVTIGGTSEDEITGTEASTGAFWAGTVAVSRPRALTIVIIRPGYEPIRLEGYIVQPASVLVPLSQRLDLNYSNPE